MTLFIETVFNDELVENSQATDNKMALGIIEEDHITNITPWFKCREFFNDFFIKNEMGDELDHYKRVYGYNFGHVSKFSIKDIVLLYENNYSKTLDLEKFKNVLDQFDEYWNVNTIVSPIDDNNKYKKYVIIPPTIFKNNNIGFSYFTNWVRMAFLYASGRYTEFPEIGNINKIRETLHYADVGSFLIDKSDYVGNRWITKYEDIEKHIDILKEGIKLSQREIFKKFAKKFNTSSINIHSLHAHGVINYIVQNQVEND